jgi:hypothetical protein
MSFGDLFRKDRPNKMLQITPSRLVAAFTRTSGGWHGLVRLEPDGDGTRVLVEHSGFDVSRQWGDQALRGAEFGWQKMFDRLTGVVAGLAGRRDR